MKSLFLFPQAILLKRFIYNNVLHGCNFREEGGSKSVIEIQTFKFQQEIKVEISCGQINMFEFARSNAFGE